MLAHCGVIPLAARGYVLLVGAERVAGRRLTEAEHRACRDHIDRGVPLPPGEPFDASANNPAQRYVTELGDRHP